MNKTIFRLIIASIALSLAAGCVPRTKTNPFLPDIIRVATTTANQDASGEVTDIHYVSSADFFIGEEASSEGSWSYVRLAKMNKLPSDGGKAPAEFIAAMDSSHVWTQFYSKTRLAKASDLSPGTVVYFLDIKDVNGIYRPPANSQEARSSWWIRSQVQESGKHLKKQVILNEGMRAYEGALRCLQ